MKRLLWTVGSVAVVATVVLLMLRVVGFNPGATSPGLWLKGEVAPPVTDWTFAKEGLGMTAIQTRQWFFPALAHSVTTARFVHKGRLYVASGYPASIKLPEGRHWNRNVLADPHVRLRIDGKLYDGMLVYLKADDEARLEVLRAWGPMMFAPGFFLHVWRVDPTDEHAG